MNVQTRDVDTDPHSFHFLDPDPGGKIFHIKTEKCKEIVIDNNCKLIQFLKVNLHKAPLFLTFEQSFKVFTTIENSSRVVGSDYKPT